VPDGISIDPAGGAEVDGDGVDVVVRGGGGVVAAAL
jgi:hypothetical protein